MQKPNSIIKEFLTIFSIFLIGYFSLFLFINKTGLNPQTLQSEDFISTAVVPFSLIKERNFDLNEYYDLLTEYYPHPDNPAYVPYYLKPVGEKLYSFFPSFTSIVVLPIYIIPAYLGYDQSIEGIRILSRLGGAFITSLSVAVFWMILKQTQLSKHKRIILLLIYALGTNSLSTSSQGLWQHGTSQLFNSLGLFMMLLGYYGLGGLSFGLSTIGRPTNLLSLVVFGIFTYYKTKDKKSLASFILLGTIPLLVEFGIDTYLYGNILNTGYGSHNKWTANIFEGFAGLLFSPSKGLFITTPVMVFILYGFYKVLISPNRHKINSALAAVSFLHLFIMGKWYNWFGGYSWGTRMASDVLPYLVFLLIPFVESKYFRNKRIRYVFYTSAIIGFIYHLSGLVFFDGVWHTIFDGKDKYWLWSIENSEPVFTLKRAISKLGVIENPIPLEFRAPK